MTALHIPSILFGQPERTLFTVNGEPAVWFQDVSVDFGVMARYTTLGNSGMMSVYLSPTEGDPVTADSDRTILCDEHGNPTEVKGIQRYFPPSVLCPAYLEVGERGWKRTEGQWAWCPGTDPDGNPLYPDEPLSENDRYRHDNSLWFETIDGELCLHHDEDFWYWEARPDWQIADGLFVMEYSRGFLYRVADRTLLQFTDNLSGRVYEQA